jgi:hypothetical protein
MEAATHAKKAMIRHYQALEIDLHQDYFLTYIIVEATMMPLPLHHQMIEE